MRRATLTITELRIPAGHSHARRRTIAAVFGILALLTQAGFTLGASAALTAATPGSLAADLAKLCLASIETSVGEPDDSQPENAVACEHCTLCSIATASAKPSGDPDIFRRTAASPVYAADPRHAHRQDVIRFRNPRAPPV